MNLVKLYTHNSSVYINTAELNSEKKLLRMYTKTGAKLSEVGRTAKIREFAANGCHRNNLYASKKLAEADSCRIMAEFAKGI